MERDRFLFEVQRIAIEIENLIDEYNMRDDVMSLMIVGVLEPSQYEDEEFSQLKAIYGYNLHSRDELQELLNFASESYQDPDEPDLDDLLKGLGISLN